MPDAYRCAAFIKKIASGNLQVRRVLFLTPIRSGLLVPRLPVEVLVRRSLCRKNAYSESQSRSDACSVTRPTMHCRTASQISRKASERQERRYCWLRSGGTLLCGLSCATWLRRDSVREEPQAGGLDTYGMAEYKMPQAVSSQRGRTRRRYGREIYV